MDILDLTENGQLKRTNKMTDKVSGTELNIWDHDGINGKAVICKRILNEIKCCGRYKVIENSSCFANQTESILAGS